MCDVFEDHPDVAQEREKLWPLIRATPNLDWLLLTKRPENILAALPPDWGDGYPTVWLGTSIEDMRVAYRSDELVKVPAVVRFISYEPALGPLDDLDLSGIDFLIYGGESGLQFRPDNLDWARTMRKKCRAAGIAFFFKQRSGRKSGTEPTLDGTTYHEYPTPRIVTPACASFVNASLVAEKAA